MAISETTQMAQQVLAGFGKSDDSGQSTRATHVGRLQRGRIADASRAFLGGTVPKWGLTKTQRGLSPWGIDPDLLRPSKAITDPVHDVIYLNYLERLVLDSTPMQRLRRIYQLGTTHEVYPGATHTRSSVEQVLTHQTPHKTPYPACTQPGP
jgi:hypothetical protein